MNNESGGDGVSEDSFYSLGGGDDDDDDDDESGSVNKLCAVGWVSVVVSVVVITYWYYGDSAHSWCWFIMFTY